MAINIPNIEDVPTLPPTDIPKPTVQGPAIGEAELHAAQQRLEKYKEGKAILDERLIENEDWWKLQHWRNFKNPHGGDWKQDKRQAYNNRPVSAWLFNSIMNKHADAMDNFPEPAVLPRARDDEQSAKVLSSVLPVIFENCQFEGTYSSCWWDKLKNGSCIYGVFYNPKLYNGIGDIDIRRVDMLNFYWEPGKQNIQESKDIFLLTLRDNDMLEAEHPELKNKLRDTGLTHKQYHYDDHVDTSNKSIVVDWYYKVNHGRGDVLHYVQWVDDYILFASENMPEYQETGFYAHGKYPFVVDCLFEEKGTPAGFGYIDVMRSPQEYIDRLSGNILDNAMWASKPRFFAKNNMSINEEELLDLTRQIVHTAGSPNDDNLMPIATKELSGNTLSVLQSKIDELKETSGNRDFSQGGTAAGVTSGSAIAALQEAGSKGSRDMIKATYRAYTEICNLVIELVRQFYDMPRAFRITGENGAPEYIEFNNAGMQARETQEFGIDFSTKEPVFDVNVKPQRTNPYSRVAQNDLALQFYNLGFFNPELTDQALAAIDMMDFEGKEKVKETIRNNGTMYEKIQQLQQTQMQMAQLIADTTGDQRILAASMAQPGEQETVPSGAVRSEGKSQAEKSRERTANMTSVV